MRSPLQLCPVEGCEWTFNPLVLPAPRFLLADTGELVSQTTDEEAEVTKKTVRDHLESHDVFDFWRTIQDLRQELAQYGSGIRPHVYGQQERQP